MTKTSNKALYLEAKEAYYNSDSPIMTDKQFDRLENALRKEFPKWKELKNTGISVADKKAKADLPEYMPSLNKYYPEGVEKYLAKEGRLQLVMNKLDGTSLQIVYRKGKPSALYTRGDGIVGGDISFLLPHINVPKSIPLKEETILRAEALLERDVFAAKWQGKSDDGLFVDARNMVNGLFNRRTPHKAMADVSIVVLSIFNHPIEEGLLLAEKWGFDTVTHKIENHLSSDRLCKLLAYRKRASAFDIDGLVLVRRATMMTFKNADRPKFMTAFKENVGAGMIATVKRIIWQTSSTGRLIPKVEIKPIQIGNVEVTYVTCHNATWMQDRNIGPGAKIEVIRSGDVIPKIVGVVKAGKFQPPKGKYIVKGVHFVEAKASAESDIRKIQRFVAAFAIDHVGPATIKRAYSEGVITNSKQYMRYWHNKQLYTKLTKADVGPVMSRKIVNEFDKAFGNGVTMRQLILSSNAFEAGIGSRKLAMIENHYSYDINVLHDLVQMSESHCIEILSKVPGFKAKSIKLFLDATPKLRRFMSVLKYVKVRDVVAPKKIDGKLSNKKITFTGYRDKQQELKIFKAGGTIVPFSKKIDILLYRPGGKTSTKITTAQSAGIKVITFEDLRL